MMDEAPWTGPMTPEMWIDDANGRLADMCALAGEYGVDEDALDMMEAFGGGVSTAVETLASERNAWQRYAMRLEEEHRRIGEVSADLYDGFDATDQVLDEWRQECGITPEMLA